MDMSEPASPKDTRQPQPRYESILQHLDDDIPSSLRSTDTVRKRPEVQTLGYGTLRHCFCYSPEIFIKLVHNMSCLGVNHL
jgi:hypothetical protein